ncbi:MAG TPA: FAD-binding oxidoreductase [Longimicrobiaceae bacterium]|nr:FAD-binding oxidoreductase [Longimicrobiaceae bacterium]
MTSITDHPAGFRGRFSTGDAERLRFSGASGILQILPAAVAVPQDPDDLQLLVRWAASNDISLVPRGAGTGMPGGNLGSGVMIDLIPAFRGVGPVDEVMAEVHVEPGVTLSELNRTCEAAGFHFPVDPSSGDRCTLGGMIANNSAGAHSVKYGATRDWVQSLDVILADGSAGRLIRGEKPPAILRPILDRMDGMLRHDQHIIQAEWPDVRKNSSGYAVREYLASRDAIDLIIGSEGTLALIVGARLRLAPLPVGRGVALVEFSELPAIGEAVKELLPLEPATCELLDSTFLELVRSADSNLDYSLPPGLEGVLLVEVEGDSEADVRSQLDLVAKAMAPLAERVALATDPDRQRAFWDLRHAASPIIAERAGGRVSMQFIEDGVVPIARLPDYIRLLRTLLDRYDLPAVIFGHAGDGNLHVNPLVDVSAPRWQDTLNALLTEVAQAVASLGGTLSGEHGDGRLRAPLLQIIWGSDMVERFRVVKESFDPQGILNPGVIIPLPGQKPLESLGVYPKPPLLHSPH